MAKKMITDQDAVTAQEAFEKFYEDKLAPIWKRQEQIAAELYRLNPNWGFIGVFVVSSDLANAEPYEREFEAGKLDFRAACQAMGSYARFDFAHRQYLVGRVSAEEFYDLLPELWRSSDMDDTKEEYFLTWQAMKELNSNKIIVDGLPLPHRKYLTVYHGQDRAAESIGISWTLKRDIAVKFAKGAWMRQNNRDGVVLEGLINRKNILAYLTGRNEAEIICNPADVLDMQRTEMEE